MKKEQILVVDHIQQRREHLVQLLEELEMTVVQAGSCEDCLQILQRESFQLILSETELPIKSGLFLLKEAKQLQPEIEVILLTHNVSSFTLLQALRHGAYDFILRPIDSNEILLKSLERVLDHIAQREERNRLLQLLEEQNRTAQQALHRMKSLNNTICLMAQSEKVDEILKTMLDAAVKEVNSTNGFIALHNRTEDCCALKIWQNIPADVGARYAKQVPVGLIDAIARREKPVMVSGSLPQRLAGILLKEELQNLVRLPGLLSVPLRLKNRNAGIMLLSGHPQGSPFAEHDLLYLTQLATHAQLQLEKVGQLHLLRRKAETLENVPKVNTNVTRLRS